MLKLNYHSAIQHAMKTLCISAVRWPSSANLHPPEATIQRHDNNTTTTSQQHHNSFKTTTHTVRLLADRT